MASLTPTTPGRQPDSDTLKRVKRVIDVATNPGVLAAALGACLAVKLNSALGSGELQQLLTALQQRELALDALSALLLAGLALAAAAAWWALRRPAVYLVDFVAQRPDDSWMHSRLDSENYAENSESFPPEAVDFQRKVLWFGGLGNETYLPPWLGNHPQNTSMERAKLEFDLVVVRACRELLDRTGVKPSQIGVLIVNCSLFVPTPSLCAHIMNHFKFKPDTLSYNLGGMGCSASPVSIDLARRMLHMRPNTYALVVSTENITQNMYGGVQRSMLIPNVLFRVGGAAMLLSNKRSEAWRAKYWLHSVVRTTLAADDASYNCVMECEDAAGFRGVRLSRDLMKIAGKALKANITTLGPKVLPWSECAVFAAHLIGRALLGAKRVRAYVPDFEAAAQHICIHTGGRGVVDAIQNELGLSNDYVEPSRAALYRYGNVSSSSIWYVLAFIEHFRGIKRGDKVLQVAFGSGFKCNSAVWVANRSFSQQTYTWEGFDIAAMYADLSQLEIKLNELLQIKGRPASARPAVKAQPEAAVAAAE